MRIEGVGTVNAVLAVGNTANSITSGTCLKYGVQDVAANEFAEAISVYLCSCECLASTTFYAIIATGYLPDLQSLEPCRNDPSDSRLYKIFPG